MPNPLDYFSIGEKLGKANQFPGVKASENVLDMFNKQADSNMKFRDTLGASMALKRFENDLPLNEKDQAMADYYQSLVDGTSGEKNSYDPQDLAGVAKSLGVQEEDLMLEPTVTRFRGKAKVTNTPKLKPPVDSKFTGQINDLRSMHKNLGNNLNMMTPEVKRFMNPMDPRAARGGLGAFALKIQSIGDQGARDFITFKAETDKMFQEFRKDTTGAQAALKELGWLSPDYPEPNDPPETYIAKATEAMKRIEEGEQLFLNTLSNRGFRVGEFRKDSLNPLQTAASMSADEPKPAPWNELQEQAKLQRLVTANPLKKDFLVNRFNQRKKEALGVAE